MDIPVILLTYNRPDHLNSVLQEHKRVNTPTPIYIIDDGSDNPEQVKLLKSLSKDSKYVVLPFAHSGHRLQVAGATQLFGKLGYKYIAYTEDDVSFSINWYEYGKITLSKLLESTQVGALSLYSGHPKLSKNVFGCVFKHTDKEHFYGSCCIFINTGIANRMEEVMYGGKGANNPDVAIRWLSINNEINLFIIYPNLVQHEGLDTSIMKSPKHHSSTFAGVGKNALELL